MMFADKTGQHRNLYLIMSIASMVLVFSMAISSSFAFQTVLIFVYTLAPIQAGSLPDSAVVAGAKKEGDYGQVRLWSSIGWGTFSFLTGLLVQQTSIYSTFAVFGVFMFLASPSSRLRETSFLQGYRDIYVEHQLKMRSCSDSLFDSYCQRIKH